LSPGAPSTTEGHSRGGSIPADSRSLTAVVSDLNRVFSDNLAIAFLVVAGFLVILLIAILIQSIRLGRTRRAYRALLAGDEGGSLQQILDQHIGSVRDASRRMDDMNTMLQFLEQRTRGSLQHIGMVRFNPFEDTGSDQSFAIALLDDRKDGVVLSSLHGRANTRLFAKPIENGASRHALSTEEAQAIKIAVEGTTPVPSPR
jgi:hypothetical protein